MTRTIARRAAVVVVSLGVLAGVAPAPANAAVYGPYANPTQCKLARDNIKTPVGTKVGPCQSLKGKWYFKA